VAAVAAVVAGAVRAAAAVPAVAAGIAVAATAGDTRQHVRERRLAQFDGGKINDHST
jgi:hypothetical protein